MKLNKKLSHLNESATIALNTEVQAMQKRGIKVLNLTAGELDFETPKEIREYVIGQMHRNKYTPTLGLPELRTKIAEDVTKQYRWPVAGENVAVTTGAKQALYTVFQVILNTGDEVIIPTPTWVSYEYQVLLASGKSVFVPLTKEFDLDVNAIKKALTPKTKAVVVNSPHNPTGAVFSPKSLQALVKLLEGKNIFIIADDIYNSLLYTQEYKPITTYLKDKTYLVLISGFSKSHALTGWRIGYMVADAAIIKGVNQIQGHASGNTAIMSQLAALGSFDFHITESFLKTLKKRKTIGEKILRTIPQVSFHSPLGAFYFFIDIRKIDTDSARFCERLLRETEVALVPGEAFHAPGFIRVSFACDEIILKEALQRIKKFVANY
jgi:aspartate/methionine/tyrosine aminotransferase